MKQHIRRLRLILADWTEPKVTEVQRADIDALEWAIDQLRWRRVSEEIPTEDGVYSVLSQTNEGGPLYPDMAQWCFGDKWDGIPWAETNIVYWRPFETPEGK